MSSLSFSVSSPVLNIIFSTWKAFDKYIQKMNDEHFTILCGVICLMSILPTVETETMNFVV